MVTHLPNTTPEMESLTGDAHIELPSTFKYLT